MSHVLQHLPLSHPAVAIICTASPSNYEAETIGGSCQIKTSRLRELLDVGMRVVRINFSHVQPDDYEKIRCLIAHIRQLEKDTSQPIPILMDLQGPEIRIVEILDRKLKSLPHSRSIHIRQGTRLEISTRTDAAKALH